MATKVGLRTCVEKIDNPQYPDEPDGTMKGQTLSELQAVVVIARRGGFRAAARELEVSPTALSHGIANLEARLGVRLFNRTTRSVRLTPAGEAFIAEVTPALDAIRGAFDQVNQHRDTPRGLIRINSNSVAARESVLPLVAEFLQRFREMRVDLVVDDRLVDIVADGFDAGVRLDGVPEDMIAIQVGEKQRLGVFASPEYFKRHKIPKSPTDLQTHECIRIRLPSGAPFKWEFERHGKTFKVDVPGRLTLDREDLIIDATRAGLGMGYFWRAHAAEDIAAGRLVEVLPGFARIYGAHELYYPSRRYMAAGPRAFFDLAREMNSAKSDENRRTREKQT
jgi:DNA-binding transcriptional LysR family regulator